MRTSYLGFTWESELPKVGQKTPTRAQALAALASIPPVGVRSEAYRQAWAAYECCDYVRVLDRVEHAFDYAEARDGSRD